MLKLTLCCSMIMMALSFPVQSTAADMTGNATVNKEIAFFKKAIKMYNRASELCALAKDDASARQVAAEMDELMTDLGAMSEADAPKIDPEQVTPELKALCDELANAVQRLNLAIKPNEQVLDAAIKAHQISEVRKTLNAMILDMENGSEKGFHKKYANTEQKNPLWNGEADFAQKKNELIGMFKNAANVKDEACLFEDGDIAFTADNKTPPTYVVFSKKGGTWKFNIFRKKEGEL